MRVARSLAGVRFKSDCELTSKSALVPAVPSLAARQTQDRFTTVLLRV
jgi:hypothetical protein